jgi:hypothetical protein
MSLALLSIVSILRWDVVAAFTAPAPRATIGIVRFPNQVEGFRWKSLLKVVASSSDTTYVYQSIFNFTDSDENAVSKFERIDDAVRRNAT